MVTRDGHARFDSDQILELVTEVADLSRSVPDDLRIAAFREVLRWALGRVGFPEEHLPVTVDRSITTVTDHGELDEYGRVSSFLGVARDDVESVFAIEADEVTLAVPTSRMPSSVAEATRLAAIVISAARRALDLATAAPAVRDVLAEYGKYDSSNFMATVKSIDPTLLTVKGSPGGKAQELIIRRGGVEKAAQHVRELAGTS